MKSEKEEEEGRKRKRRGGGESSPASAPPDKQQLVFTVRHNNRTADQHQAQLSPGDISPAPTQAHLAGGGIMTGQRSQLLIVQMMSSNPCPGGKLATSLIS